ncbi:MAG: hypothetical protein ACI8QZ_000058 [Chlamydiales bacterium]|jgi:hypothetical protein
MDEPQSEITPETVLAPRSRLGWSMMAFGGVLLLWAVLGLASAGYGSRPTRDFAARRSYNMVKRDVHTAFPTALMRAAAGLSLLALGARTRRRD